MNSKPRISVILFVDQHNSMLLDTLQGFVNQTCSPTDFEVVTVDSKSSRDWSAEVKEISRSREPNLNIKYFRLDNPARAVRNNFGASQASAELVLFESGDFIPQSKFVAAHLQFHEAHPESHMVAIGPGVSGADQRKKSRVLAWLEDSGSLFGVPMTQKDLRIPKNFFYVANASIKKEFFLSAGMFDEDFPYDAWDDFELGMRLAERGMVACLVPDALAIHNHLVTLEERRTRLEWAGESAAILKSKYPDFPLSLCWPGKEQLKGYINWLAYGLTGNTKYQVRYWRHLLDASFATGYRRGQRALKRKL